MRNHWWIVLEVIALLSVYALIGWAVVEVLTRGGC